LVRPSKTGPSPLVRRKVCVLAKTPKLKSLAKNGNAMNKAFQASSLAFVNIFGLDSTTAGVVLFVSDGETSRLDEVQCSVASVGWRS